ncbi:hypothetical protein AAFF_G00273440 [Aldrovandia affinis]|uniref:Uncharacterized protein n=1 Tax=Aldrovandia affinis TaxID=143900 RepID=A0AAD7WSC9_9TELE|nr:hypothetical protein AAFF_G00273440 [Aldrovandia affinis]
MKTVLLFSCVLGMSLAFPVRDSGSNEAMMRQMYRFYEAFQQQVNSAAAQPPAQGQDGLFFNLHGMAGMPMGEESDEEEVPHGSHYPHGGAGSKPALALNSDEVEEAEEAEEAEGAEGAEGAEAVEAEPAAAGTQGPDVPSTGAPTEVAAEAAADPVVTDTVAVDTVAVDTVAVDTVAVPPPDLPNDVAADTHGPVDLPLSVDNAGVSSDLSGTGDATDPIVMVDGPLQVSAVLQKTEPSHPKPACGNSMPEGPRTRPFRPDRAPACATV